MPTRPTRSTKAEEERRSKKLRRQGREPNPIKRVHFSNFIVQ